MPEEVAKRAVSVAPAKQVNQYGSKSIHADHVENMTVNVYGDRNSDPCDDTGKPFTPILPTRYDRERRIVYLGSEEIILPVQLVPQDELDPNELPYINALCEVYAERIQQAVSSTAIPREFRRHYANQRKAYFGAESAQRSVREIFADGEAQFKALKSDAYEGIEATYFSDRHTTGFDRLEAVLEKITNTSLSGSALMNVVGLISNLEKKGICHMMVNDGDIKSWVKIDDEII